MIRRQTRVRRRPEITAMLWDLLDIETQMALVKTGLIDPDNVDIREDRFGVRLFLLGETTEELERMMKERPTGPYAAFISGGPARPAPEEEDQD